MTKTLHFVGVMTEQQRVLFKSAFEQIENGEDREKFLQAVDELFNAPENWPSTQEEAADSFFTSEEIEEEGGLINQSAGETTAPVKRFEKVLKKLLPRLKTFLSQALVVRKVSEAFALEVSACRQLLTTWLHWPDQGDESKSLDAFLVASFAESNPHLSVTREAFPVQFKTYILLHKAATVISTLELSTIQLAWIFRPESDVWPDLNDLPLEARDAVPLSEWDKWKDLWRLCELRESLPKGEALLDKIFSLACNPEDGIQAEKIVAYLSNTLGWAETDLETLIDLLEADVSDFCGESLLWRLQRDFQFIRRLGISVDLCGDLCRSLHGENGPDNGRRIANEVVQAVRAKYDEARWLELAKPLRNELRERQRAALVAYLSSHHRKDRRFRNADALYTHLLIDPEMSPCMMTSRIKQAHGTVQLFVQRCLMSLEREVKASEVSDTGWRQWRWMKNYRVWEANRKIFLYPENWIEPELRDDKSPFFKELESELMQSDLTLESAAQALLGYLNKLDQVAHLEIVGYYHQKDIDTTDNIAIDVYHVFGRTTANPHVYYYRKRIDSVRWTAWERVDLDIQSDHLIPVVWNRRIYLFWPTFTEKQKESNKGSEKKLVDMTTAELNPDKKWEIKLNWSEYQDGKWSTKNISEHSIEFDFYKPFLAKADDPATFFFRSFIDDQNQMNVILLQTRLFSHYFSRQMEVPAFRFCRENTEPMVMDLWVDALSHPRNTNYYYMYYQENPRVSEEVKDILFLPSPEDSSALNKTPGIFQLLPQADGSSLSQHPFFYMDGGRTFFVEYNLTCVPDSVLDKYHIDPGSLLHAADPYANYLNPEFELPGSQESDFDDSPHSEPTIPDERPSDPDHHVRSRLRNTSTLKPTGALVTNQHTLATEGFSTTGMTFYSNWDLDVTGENNWVNSYTWEYRYRFSTFFHPHTVRFMRELRKDGLDGLLQRKIQTEPRFGSLQEDVWLDFENDYEPTTEIVDTVYPTDDVDFEPDGAYSLYNWELFFHAPLLIAERLRQNQRFEDAQKWFHYVFDPTDRSAKAPPQKYWKTRPFYERSEADYRWARIQDILELLAKGGNPDEFDDLSPVEKKRLSNLNADVSRWRMDPFKPHLIASLRLVAYQKAVVMKYIENLIEWGDQLFRRDTIESINEATQLYIMAAEILGCRPEEIPARAAAGAQTFDSLEGKLGDFSNAMVAIEEFILPSAPSGRVRVGDRSDPSPVMLYFCPPKNEKLLGYWDVVADRLFKIRHCMNIEGTVRQLPLFEPPIDPALLVRAAAAGMDIGSVLNEITGGVPYYRFMAMVQKAIEVCAELKSLGSTLLATLEKRDAESMAQIRARHETDLLNLVEKLKEQQLEEAEQNLEALRRSRDITVVRYIHYQKLLGIENPELPIEGETIPDHEPSAHVRIMEEAGVKMIPLEKEEMDQLKKSDNFQDDAAEADLFASIANTAPNFNCAPFGNGFTFGGSNVGAAFSAWASSERANANKANYKSNESAKLAQYAWRAHDWTLQNNLAAKEIMQIDTQILAAQIRVAMAEKELKNHRTQMTQAKEVEGFLRDKYTNEALYGWMSGQISSVYFQSYQLAYDIAKRSERAFRNELGIDDSNYICGGYWDNLKKGLLAGEKLSLDLKRMETTYHEKNKREYELTKNISLLQINPMALIQLRTTGMSTVSLPEELFDLDCPGHYFRRIKSVAVSIPCVTGSYSGINCTLTLLKSSIRKTTLVDSNEEYGYSGPDDSRFFTDYAGIESIVTSTAQADAGMFEPSLNDPRRLPFEYSGVISEWRLQLPANPSEGEPQQFDYNSISDVILHIRYTAREGGDVHRKGALSHLTQQIAAAEYTGCVRLFSIRHEFPSEWSRFKNIGEHNERYQLSLQLRSEHYPFWSQGRLEEVKRLDFLAKTEADSVDVYLNLDDVETVVELKTDDSLGGLCVGELAESERLEPISKEGEPFALNFRDNSIEDLWIAVRWGSQN